MTATPTDRSNQPNRRVVLRQWGLENFEVTTVGREVPGPGQVLVRTQAASLNFRDLLIAAGMYNPRIPLPLVPLSDSSGTIVEVGAGATKFDVGARVMPIHAPGWVAGRGEPGAGARGGEVPGVLEEFSLFDQRDLVPVPPHLTAVQAAALPCAAVTAWNGLFGGAEPLRPGQRVLILGTGGVALFALQFAKMAGAEVAITSKDGDKLARASDMGADHQINYRENPNWGRSARRIFGGDGADLVLELGGSATLPESLRAVRRGGSVALIGSVTGATVENLSLPPIFMRAVTLRGVAVGPRDMFEDMTRAISHHRIVPVVDRVYSGLESTRDGLEHLASASHFGKIVIDVAH